jgi:tryptophan 2,3-dioxygenase
MDNDQSEYSSIVSKLEQKYEAMGQDLSSYLDGLLYSDYLTYWDYIHLDTLLSLQNPKTSLPDEKVFIIYHQITELYFKLALAEIQQIAEHPSITKDFFLARLERLIRYFQNLESSFQIMVDGLEREQFLKFRMALLPASGFQSAQYRLIEICSTDMINLVGTHDRERLRSEDLQKQLEHLYWRSGATELASGKKTLTLRQFEEKYMKLFLETGKGYQETNLLRLAKKYFNGDLEVEAKLKLYDQLVNIHWAMAHMKSAAKYLKRDPEDIKATGGTNWQKYLPPRFQRIIFFPELYSEKEIEGWGSSLSVFKSA